MGFSRPCIGGARRKINACHIPDNNYRMGLGMSNAGDEKTLLLTPPSLPPSPLVYYCLRLHASIVASLFAIAKINERRAQARQRPRLCKHSLFIKIYGIRRDVVTRSLWSISRVNEVSRSYFMESQVLADFIIYR
jgi:hypothetical protein